MTEIQVELIHTVSTRLAVSERETLATASLDDRRLNDRPRVRVNWSCSPRATPRNRRRKSGLDFGPYMWGERRFASCMRDMKCTPQTWRRAPVQYSHMKDRSTMHMQHTFNDAACRWTGASLRCTNASNMHTMD